MGKGGGAGDGGLPRELSARCSERADRHADVSAQHTRTRRAQARRLTAGKAPRPPGEAAAPHSHEGLNGKSQRVW